ncbi:MAG: VanZ family protein [Solobacterium sp.]|nr:VanZ family protein [Solobacterium sp.]
MFNEVYGIILTMLIDMILFFLLYITVLLPWFHKKRQMLIGTVFSAYLMMVAMITLSPVIVSLPLVFNHPYRPINLVPFVDVIHERGDFMRQVYLNILMFVPFGFLCPMFRNKAGFLDTLVPAFLTSLTIELVQPLVSWRIADITDLITNTSGAVIGWLIFTMLRALISLFGKKKR